MTAVEQQAEPPKAGPALVIEGDETRPGAGLLAAHGGKAVPRQIDQHQPAAEIEEIDLLRASWRMGDAGQSVMAGERVDQARLADIGAPGEGDLRQARRRQGLGRGGAGDEAAFPGEEEPAGLELCPPTLCLLALVLARILGQAGFFLAICHIRYRCCVIDSRLFQAQ